MKNKYRHWLGGGLLLLFMLHGEMCIFASQGPGDNNSQMPSQEYMKNNDLFRGNLSSEFPLSGETGNGQAAGNEIIAFRGDDDGGSSIGGLPEPEEETPVQSAIWILIAGVVGYAFYKRQKHSKSNVS